MSLKKQLRVVMVCAVLQFGVLGGVPMRPEEVRELMNQMNQPRMAHVLPSGHDEGHGPPKPE